MILLTSSLLSESTRTWTDTDGRSIEATVIRVDDTRITLRVRGRDYRWPIEKLIETDRTFLAEWQKLDEAKRAEHLGKLVGSFEKYPLTARAYEKPHDYLKGDVFEEYLKRTVPEYTVDMRQGLDYAITDQTAALFVPTNYDESEPFGVYVEITAGSRAFLPQADYCKIFAKHKLIYICPGGAGNKAILSYRMGLALDALTTVKSAYHIDETRCYIGGVSGGGVSSTLINYLRPEHFRGAINTVRGALLERYTLEKDVAGAVNYKAGSTYPPFLPHLAKKHVRMSQRYRDKRWAFVSGEKDYNYEFAKASGPQWTKQGYRAKYFHVPGMGHNAAPGEALDAVLTWMAK